MRTVYVKVYVDEDEKEIWEAICKEMGYESLSACLRDMIRNSIFRLVVTRAPED